MIIKTHETHRLCVSVEQTVGTAFLSYTSVGIACECLAVCWILKHFADLTPVGPLGTGYSVILSTSEKTDHWLFHKYTLRFCFTLSTGQACMLPPSCFLEERK